MSACVSNNGVTGVLTFVPTIISIRRSSELLIEIEFRGRALSSYGAVSATSLILGRMLLQIHRIMKNA